MIYGLTNNGFVTKRLETIKAEMEAALKEEFGDIDVSPESVFGQLIGVHAEIAALVWEQLENIYNAMYPNSAEGLSLDNVCQFLGILRLAATQTEVDAVIYGDPTTVVPTASLASVSGRTPMYSLDGAVSLTGSSMVACRFQVTDPTIPTGWDVTIGGNIHHIPHPGGTPSAEEIAEDIYNKLVAEAPVQATLDGTYVYFILNDPSSEVTVEVSAGLAIVKMGRIGLFRADTVGPNVVNEHELNTIETPVTGWDSVNNYVAGVTGRNAETDDALRLRRLKSLRINATSNLEAIRSRVLAEVANVSQCLAFENETDMVVDGRPPHSFELIIVGGDKQEIAEKIWELKPAGIQTYGNIETTEPPVPIVTDSQGFEHAIYFSRPIPKYAHIRVTLTLYNEEIFPDDGIDTIERNILTYGNSIGIGIDIIIQRFYAEIFKVPGVKSALIETAVTANPGDIPTYGTVDIPIATGEVSVWAADRIHVSIP